MTFSTVCAPRIKKKQTPAENLASAKLNLPLALRRLLLVEDDYLIALAMEDWLKAASFEVVEVVSTEPEAVAAAARHAPQIVVMDIRLANGGDGVNAAIEIFRASGIRSLFTSAHIDHATRLRASAAHPLGWLLKPFDEKSLADAVAAAFTLNRETPS